MGWGHCGEDSKGRPIGYVHQALCDHPDCTKKIHRGLDYACGGMHGEDEVSCERYFCHRHLSGWVKQPFAGGMVVSVCADCEKAWREANPEAAAELDAE